MTTLATMEPSSTILDEMMSDRTNETGDQQADSEEVLKTPEQLTQQILVERVLQGDKEAFGEIVKQYNGLMMRTAYMIIGDRDVAEDAVQDALIQAWQHLSGLRESGALRPWLMRIVVNQCISYKRKVARTTAFVRQSIAEQSINLAAEIADDHKGRIERDWDLAETVKKLPAKQQAVIVLHYYHGMTLPSMSQVLHISENTLKKRIQVALINLRRALHTNNMSEALIA